MSLRFVEPAFCKGSCANGKCVILKGKDARGTRIVSYHRACSICYTHHPNELKTDQEAVEWLSDKN